jgi:hypothetical protein
MAEQLLQGLKYGEAGKSTFYPEGTLLEELPKKHQALARELGIVGEPARIVVGDAELADENEALRLRIAELEAALEEANDAGDSTPAGDSGDA